MNLFLIGAGIVGAGVVGALIWERRKPTSRQDIRFLRILPHVNVRLNPETVFRMVNQFGSYQRTKGERSKKGREWFRFLIHTSDEGIAIYIGYPQDRQTGVKKALEMAYPDCELHDIPHSEIPLPDEKGGYGGFFHLRERGEREGLALNTLDLKRDEFADVLLFMEPGTWLDLVFSPATSSEMNQLIRRTKQAIRPDPVSGHQNPYETIKEVGQAVLQEFDPRNTKGRGSTKRTTQVPKPPKISDLDPIDQVRFKSTMSRFSGREKVFSVSIALWSEHPHASSVIRSIAARIESAINLDNGVRLKRTRKTTVAKIEPAPFTDRTMLWKTEELANLFHLPDGRHQIMSKIPHLEQGQRNFSSDEFSEGISVGMLNHPLGKREARIPQETFTKHFVITGVIGGGKSSLITTIFQSMINNWLDDPHHAAGFTFLDPAQETALTILNRLLEAERQGRHVDWDRVHYASLRNSKYPIGLNLLHNSDTETVLGLLQKVAPAKAVRMDRLAFNAIASLIEANDHHTLLGILPLVTDENFRDRVIYKIQDYYLRQFWKTEFEKFNNGSDTSVDALINRLSPFTRNLDLRRMVGQREWSIPIQKWMDEGHIFLIDLLNVDDTVKTLAGAHLINQYHYTAKSRPLGRRRAHFLVEDEAHLVQVPILRKILAEDRKFGLCLGLITQYPEQFEPWLQADLENIVVTIAACVQGSGSATTMAKMLKGHFTADQLQKLPERTAAICTQNDRKEVDSFMTQSDPPYVYLPDGRIAQYRNTEDEQLFLKYTLAKAEELQKRDWKSVTKVDHEIEEYLRNPTVLQTIKQESLRDRWRG